MCVWRRPVESHGVCVRCRGQLRELSAAQRQVVPRMVELRPGLDREQRPEVRQVAGRQFRELLLRWRTDQRIEQLYLRESSDWSERRELRSAYSAAYERRAELYGMGYSLDQIRQIRQVLNDQENLPSDGQLHDILATPVSDDDAAFDAWWRTGSRVEDQADQDADDGHLDGDGSQSGDDDDESLLSGSGRADRRTPS